MFWRLCYSDTSFLKLERAELCIYTPCRFLLDRWSYWFVRALFILSKFICNSSRGRFITKQVKFTFQRHLCKPSQDAGKGPGTEVIQFTQAVWTAASYDDWIFLVSRPVVQASSDRLWAFWDPAKTQFSRGHVKSGFTGMCLYPVTARCNSSLAITVWDGFLSYFHCCLCWITLRDPVRLRLVLWDEHTSGGWHWEHGAGDEVWDVHGQRLVCG